MGLLFVSKKEYNEAVKGKEEALSWLSDSRKENKDLEKEVNEYKIENHNLINSNNKLTEENDYLQAEIITNKIAIDQLKRDLKETRKLLDNEDDKARKLASQHKILKGLLDKRDNENKHLIREISKANAIAYQIFKIIDEEDTKVSKKELRELALILRPRKSTNDKIVKMINKGEKTNEDVTFS